ncbi:hypothetical protein [Streptomyces sp. BR123]|uniref:WD40 repeat domain-containing protein n=1 Tax=Streptomyces sp. BR123 TaxID=2749828 RepID=UPI002810AECE|nr:hypothetical protein [Streptomyces sp. BR123]
MGPPLTGHTTRVEGIAFSPDGRLLATASDGGVLLYERVGAFDPAAGTRSDSASRGTPLASRALEAALCERWAIRLPSVRVGGHGLLRVAFSPDGRLLATTSLERALRLWDPVTRAPSGRRRSHRRPRPTAWRSRRTAPSWPPNPPTGPSGCVIR